MKRYKKSYLALAVGAILLTLASAACSGAYATPEIAVTPASHDFGQVGPDPVTTAFTIRNEGDGPLQIESVSTSCGCTTAEISAQTIAPGKLANLTVTFDPQAHAGAVGQFVRFVYLRTNDPTTPEVEVQISAEVVENPISEEALQ
jgi:hypothetical protein